MQVNSGIYQKNGDVNMRIKRKIELTFYSIFSIVTFHKYYICEECHKIHKRTGNEFEACGGWYRHHVFVSNDCANKVISNARVALRDAVIKSSK